jgi:hypothetical protein
MIILVLSITISAQNLMTIRQVFDYSIGDKLQISGKADGQPPNCDRITITDKYYSSDGDTVFYVQFHDSYISYLDWAEPPFPKLKFNFWQKTDTVFYASLNSSITTYKNWPLYDTSMYLYDTIITNSDRYCDSIINGNHYEFNSFEPEIYICHYGKGLGLVYDYYFSASAPHNLVMSQELIYYQKNGVGCGTPDNTTLGVDETLKGSSDFFFYPNPAETEVFLKNGTNQDKFECKLLNPIGQTIQEMELSGKTNRININDFKSGIYYLNIKHDNKITTLKLIKK